MHKPTLARERALNYDETGKLEMITNLDKVYNEIEVWGRLNHSHFVKFYELIDADEHDYMYLILELADLGQLAQWDYKIQKYVRNKKIFDTILAFLAENGAIQEGLSPVEQVARYLFRQLAVALVHLHDEVGIIHRDINLDNILFSAKDMLVKLTDFTVARADIKDSTRLFDS